MLYNRHKSHGHFNKYSSLFKHPVVSLIFTTRKDPKGERTIGVLTKLDNIQSTTDRKRVLDILDNKTKPLKLGNNITLTINIMM